MKDFRSRKKQEKNPLYHPLAFVVIFLVLIFLLFSVFNSYQKKQSAQIERQKIDDTYNVLIKKKQHYINEIDRLSSKEGLDEEFKKNNNVGEVGEKIIRIIDSS